MSLQSKGDTLIAQGIQWVILDAARCAEPVWFAHGSDVPAYSLFNQQDAGLADNGPWLIDVTDNRTLVDLCLKKDPLGHASLWLASQTPADKLVALLRTRLYAELPAGDTTRFRWYDPRVLFPYLSDSTPERRQQFLAPLTRLIHADLNPFYTADHWQVWHRDAMYCDNNTGDVLCQSVPCKEAD